MYLKIIEFLNQGHVIVLEVGSIVIVALVLIRIIRNEWPR